MNLDQLASGLASGTITRRRALAAIGAGAVGALLPWASRAEAQPGCRGEGHPCEGNQVCCEGLECIEALGPGAAARCGKKKPLPECPRDAKKCEKDHKCPKDHKCKPCEEKKDFSCERKDKKESECEKKHCKCVVDTKTKKKVCVCEKKVCVKEKKH